MQAETRKQHAHALEIGISASPSSAAALASSRQRMPSSPARTPTSAAPSSASPSISRSATSNRRPSSAATRAGSRAVAVSPLACARYPSWKASQPCSGPGSSGSSSRCARRSHPRHGHGAVEVELVGREPGRHPRGAARRHRPPVEQVGALAACEHGRGVVEPPRRPAQPLEGLGGLVKREGSSNAVRAASQRASRSSAQPGRARPAAPCFDALATDTHSRVSLGRA